MNGVEMNGVEMNGVDRCQLGMVVVFNSLIVLSNL